MTTHSKSGQKNLLGQPAARPALLLISLLLLWLSPPWSQASSAELATAAAPSAAPGGKPSTNVYTYLQQHDRDGTGKFYCGREIALVMGHEAASWLERPERNQEENTDLLIESLALKHGMIVADIGAGTGYLSRRMAAKVAPEGRIIAQDIQPEMLALALTNASRAGITNIQAVLGTVSDPRLAASSVDMVIMVDVYHEFEFPFEMMQGICKALKPHGQVVFVEFRGEDENVPIKPLHKMTEAQLKKEMSQQQLKWLQTKEVLPWQHIVAFIKD